MAILERIEPECVNEVSRNELRPDVVLGEAVVDGEILDPGGEPLVQPEMRPPFLCRIQV